MTTTYGEVFAKVYSKMWGEFSERVAPAVIDFYESESGAHEGVILDVCCGTGHFAKYVLDRGYGLIGVDLSENMLKYALENCAEYVENSRAKFIQGDASDFSIDTEVDLAVSMYDSLNHLESFEKLRGCFESVYRALKPGGFFIFDLNTKKGLRDNWNSVHLFNNEEITVLNRGFFLEDENMALTKITGFVKNETGLYERFDETIKNTVFDLNLVKKALLAESFSEVYFSSLPDFNRKGDFPEERNRSFIIARK